MHLDGNLAPHLPVIYGPSFCSGTPYALAEEFLYRAFSVLSPIRSNILSCGFANSICGLGFGRIHEVHPSFYLNMFAKSDHSKGDLQTGEGKAIPAMKMHRKGSCLEEASIADLRADFRREKKILDLHHLLKHRQGTRQRLAALRRRLDLDILSMGRPGSQLPRRHP